MKFAVLFLLFGCAYSASLYDALDYVAEEQELLFSLDNGQYLQKSMGFFDKELYGDDDNDVIKEMKNKLRDLFGKILDKIKEHIANKEEIGELLKEKVKQVIEKLKQWKIELGQKIREKLRDLRDKVPDEWKKVIDELLNRKESSTEKEELDLLRELKRKIPDFDKNQTIKWIEQNIRNDYLSYALVSVIEQSGDRWKEMLLEVIDIWIGKEEKRPLKEYWEKVKNYFKDLKIELHDKFMKFGKWVKENVRKSLDKGKHKIENIKAIAREFINHAKHINKDIANEAKEFFRQYKEELGDLWDKLNHVFKNTSFKDE